MRLDKVRVKDWGELPSEALKEKRRDDPWDNAFPSPPSSHISLLSSVCRSTKGCTVEQWDRPLINISTLVPGSAFTKEGGVWLDRQIAYDNYGYWNRRHDETRLPFITLEAPLHPKRSDSRDVSRQIILKKNRRQMVTAVNPNVSRETGRHVLDVEAQARHYDLDGKPKGKDGAYTKYRGWYLYEDNIMPDELVGRWMWDDLVKNERWYEDVIMPAFKEHNEKFQASLHGGRHRWNTKAAKDEVAMRRASEEQGKSSRTRGADHEETASEIDRDIVAIEKGAALAEWKAQPTICATVGKILSIGGIFIWKKSSKPKTIKVGEMRKME